MRSYLEDQGLGDDRMSSEGYGETRPLCTDIPELEQNKRKNRKKIEECRAANRRVQFKILEVNGKAVKADESVTIEEKKVITEEIPEP